MFRDISIISQFLLSGISDGADIWNFYFQIVKRLARERLENMLSNVAWIWLIAVGIFVFFLHYLFWVYEIRDVWVVYPPLILCDILGLGVALGFVELRTRSADNEKLRQLLELEKKQFEMTKTNVEFVNRNAHDLKHYIHKLQRLENPENQELEEVLTQVEAYESAFQTGNAALDIVLTQKKLVCQQKGISFTCMADGTALHFMKHWILLLCLEMLWIMPLNMRRKKRQRTDISF